MMMLATNRSICLHILPLHRPRTVCMLPHQHRARKLLESPLYRSNPSACTTRLPLGLWVPLGAATLQQRVSLARNTQCQSLRLTA